MHSSSAPATKLEQGGLAEPFNIYVGDIITSLSFPYVAVPVLGSILIPLLILFGNLTAPESSTIS